MTDKERISRKNEKDFGSLKVMPSIMIPPNLVGISPMTAPSADIIALRKKDLNRYVECPRMIMDKWTWRYLDDARQKSTWSKDGTKIGAVIVRPDKTTAAHGFNGLPPGMNDDHLKDRAFKNLCVLHAEDNALLTCKDDDLTGYSMYLWGLHPCGNCASKIVMVGIKKVVYIPFYNMTASESWKASCDAAKVVFKECGVQTTEYSHEEFLEGKKIYG